MVHTFQLSKVIDNETFESLLKTLKGLYFKEKIWITKQYEEFGVPNIFLCKFKPKRKNKEGKKVELKEEPYRYCIFLSINPSRMLNKNSKGYQSTDILCFNSIFVKVIYERLFELFPQLDDRYVYNEDYYFRAFQLRRIDYTFDLFYQPEQYITFINQGYIIQRNSYKRCYYESKELLEEIEDDEFDEELEALIDKELEKDKFQSDVKYIYYKSKSLNINIYLKGEQLKKDKLIDENDTNYDFLRIEIQVKKAKLNAIKKKFGIPYRELFHMATPEIEAYILQYYLQALTGKGHYFTLKEAKMMIDNNKTHGFSNQKKEKLKKVLEEVSIRHGISKVLELVENGKITELGKVSTVKKHLKELHSLNVNPVTISTRMNVPKKELRNSKGEIAREIVMLPNLVDMIKSYTKQIQAEMLNENGIELTEETIRRINQL